MSSHRKETPWSLPHPALPVIPRPRRGVHDERRPLPTHRYDHLDDLQPEIVPGFGAVDVRPEDAERDTEAHADEQWDEWDEDRWEEELAEEENQDAYRDERTDLDQDPEEDEDRDQEDDWEDEWDEDREDAWDDWDDWDDDRPVDEQDRLRDDRDEWDDGYDYDEDDPEDEAYLDDDWEPAGPSARTLAAVAGGVAVLVAVALVFLLVQGGPSGQSAGSEPKDPAGAAFRPPVALADDEGFVRTTVLPSGDVAVDHWLRSGTLLFQLRLVRPESFGLDVSQVRARSIRVEADGRRTDAPTTMTGPRLDLDLPGVHRVHLSYRLSGVLTRATPTGRRAVVQAAALRVQHAGRRTLTSYAVEGATVLALACAEPEAGSFAQPCGRVRRGTWGVDFPRSQSQYRVMAQVDLPEQ